MRFKSIVSVTMGDDIVAAGAKAVMDGPQGSVETQLADLGKDERGRYTLSYPVAAIRTDKDVTLTLHDMDGNKLALHNLLRGVPPGQLADKEFG